MPGDQAIDKDRQVPNRASPAPMDASSWPEISEQSRPRVLAAPVHDQGIRTELDEVGLVERTDDRAPGVDRCALTTVGAVWSVTSASVTTRWRSSLVVASRWAASHSSAVTCCSDSASSACRAASSAFARGAAARVPAVWTSYRARASSSSCRSAAQRSSSVSASAAAWAASVRVSPRPAMIAVRYIFWYVFTP